MSANVNELAHRFLEIRDKKTELDSELNILKVELAQYEEKLLAAMAENNMTGLKMNGQSISIRNSFFASLDSDNKVSDLIACGLPDMLMISSQRFKSLVKEASGQDGDLSALYKDFPGLTGKVKTGIKQKISVRKG